MTHPASHACVTWTFIYFSMRVSMIKCPLLIQTRHFCYVDGLLQAVGFCFSDYPWCYVALTHAPGLSTFCSDAPVPGGPKNATFSGYALSCPCWCSLILPPPLPSSLNWTAMAGLMPLLVKPPPRLPVKLIAGTIRNYAQLESSYAREFNLFEFKFTFKKPNGCGWATAAVFAVEAALVIAYPAVPPVSLSAQIISDCANSRYGYRESACDGGSPGDALSFMSSFTIPTEAVYPNRYVTYGGVPLGNRTICSQSMLSLTWGDPWVMLSGTWSPPAHDQVRLMASVAVQPLVVVLTVGMEFLSWSESVALKNHLNWNGGVFTPFQVCFLEVHTVSVCHIVTLLL